MAKYILKQAAIYALTNEANTHSNPVKRAYTRAAAIIEQITAEDVQPVKHGRWEQIGEQSAKCTVCGGVLKSNGIDKTGKALIFNAVYHYCSYCGARMDGDTNGI